MGRFDWETPPEVFQPLDDEFGFVFDLAATKANSKCSKFFSPSDDSLAQDWTAINGACWLNPPFGRQLQKWAKKAAESAQNGATIVALYAARTNRKWFQDYVFQEAKEVRFIQGEIYFMLDGTPYPTQAPFPCVVAVYAPNKKGPAVIRSWDIKTGEVR